MINFLRFRSWLETSTAPPPAVAVRDDDALFEALVDDHYGRVYNLAYRMVRSEADAADLTQETFVRVYRALPRLRAEGAQSAWIRRIATNLCLDFLRRRHNTPPTTSLDMPLSEESDSPLLRDVADPSGEPERLLTTRERQRVLHRAISSLPDEYRTVIVLHHLEDFRVEEIADLLGVPPGTIKSRLSRARHALHRKLASYFI